MTKRVLEAYSCSDRQEISLRLKDDKMYYCVDKKPTLFSYPEPAEISPLPPNPVYM
jgi:hypothetical protein